MNKQEMHTISNCLYRTARDLMTYDSGAFTAEDLVQEGLINAHIEGHYNSHNCKCRMIDFMRKQTMHKENGRRVSNGVFLDIDQVIKHQTGINQDLPTESAIQNEEMLKEAKGLTPRAKRCLLMVMSGLSQEEIAEKLGVKPNSVQIYKSAAKKALMQAIGK